MDFKTRRINKKDRNPPRKLPSLPKMDSEIKAHIISIGGGILLMMIFAFIIVQTVKSLDFSSIIFSFGQELQTTPKGRTNILLAGIGGEGHDGGNLTDTVLVASVDYKNKLVPMISIPRDLFVTTKETGKSRINEVYWLAKNKVGKSGGLEALKKSVSEITGQEIQYYVKIDFEGFVKIVDSIGGIDLYVENDIYDPYYPRGETIQYQTFSIKKGFQHLDGDTALKYARSRKTTSDFDRAKRQQMVLQSIREKALSLNVLTDPTKIKAIYDSVSSSIDTNLSFGEIIELAKFAKDLGKDSTMPVAINDDPTDCGGLVYTPDRDFFNGAAVLLPAGNKYEYIQEFVDTMLTYTSAIMKKESVQVLNGTKASGLAYQVMSILSRFCMNVEYYGNAEKRDLEMTTIYYTPGPNGEKPESLDLALHFIPVAKTVAGIPETFQTTEKRKKSIIVIELGKDYLENKLIDPFDSLKYLAPPTPKTSTTQQAGTDSQQKPNHQ